MTPLEAYRAELRRQLAALPALQRSTITRVAAELEAARRTILAELQASLSDSRRVTRQRLLVEVERQLDAWSRAAGETGSAAAKVAWQRGMELVRAPLGAAGLGAGIGAKINPRALASIQNVLTGKISGASADAIRRIDSILLQTLVGTTAQSDAITQISEVLGSPRRRAQTILFTELGRAHAMASHAAMLEAAEKIPGLRKRWLRSGKKHPRRSHFRAHNQMVLAAEPFDIAGVKLMHPRDPNGPADHTINCGCMAVPVVDGSTLGASTVRIDPTAPMRDPDLVRRQEPTAAERAIALPAISAPAPSALAALVVDPVKAGLVPALVDALASFEATAARSPVERLAFFAPDGRLLREATGSVDRARFELPISEGLGGVLTHTHAGNSAPGYRDLLTAAAYQVQELRVVGPTTVFRVGPFDRFTLGVLERDRPDMQAEVAAAYEQVARRFPALDESARIRLAYNLVTPALARRLGIGYRRIRHDY